MPQVDAASEAATAAAAAAAAASAVKFNTDRLAKTSTVIATSRSGGDDPAGRAWMARLSAGLLTLAPTNPASSKGCKTSWYTCAMCTVTNQIDSAHGGTLRHVGGVMHVKKWLVANPQADATITAGTVRALLPPVWGDMRMQATTQFKVAAANRQV